MKSKKLKSALSSVLIMTNLINSIVTYADGGDKPEKQPSATASTMSEEELKRKCIQSLAKYADTRSKFKLKEVNREYKNVIEGVSADQGVKYLHLASRMRNGIFLDTNDPVKASFFKESSLEAKKQITVYTFKTINKTNIQKLLDIGNTNFSSVHRKLIELNLFTDDYRHRISDIEKFIQILIDNFSKNNNNYFLKYSKSDILENIIKFYVYKPETKWEEGYFYCPAGEQLTDATEEIDKTTLPILKYIELYFSDFDKIFSDIEKKYVQYELDISGDLDNAYYNKSKEFEKYIKLLSKNEIAKRIFSKQLYCLCHEYMNVYILNYQKKELDHLSKFTEFTLSMVEKLINAIFVNKSSKSFCFDECNGKSSDWINIKHYELNEFKNTSNIAISVDNLSHILDDCVKNLKSGKYDELIEYLNS